MHYKVSEVEDNLRYLSGTKRGFGFSIVAAGNGVVCTMTYATRDVAEQAREAAQRMIENAVC